jgi:rhomboid protease GluP
MSLEYRNDEPQTAEVENVDENYQRAAFVLPVYSIILIALLVAVFLCQLKADGIQSFIYGGDISVLLAGFVKQFFVEGQFWRILTGAALHGGLPHLFFNCYALYVLGKLIETISNRSHLAIVFLLSAIGGGILSLIFLPDGSAVGASGGIVGFLGYLTVYGFKRRKLLPKGFLNNMLFNIAFIAFFGIIVNINKSENMPMIDNYGHLGGLLVGAFYGFVQIPSDLYKDPREVGSTVKYLGFAALGIFISTCVFAISVLLGIIQIPFPAILLN